MNFFAAERTDRTVWGLHDPGVVVPVGELGGCSSLTAPLFAGMWTSLARRGRAPSTPTKMVIAMVLLGGGVRVHGDAARGSATGAAGQPRLAAAPPTRSTRSASSACRRSGCRW